MFLSRIERERKREIKKSFSSSHNWLKDQKRERERKRSNYKTSKTIFERWPDIKLYEIFHFYYKPLNFG